MKNKLRFYDPFCKSSPHNPLHHFKCEGVYMITSSTYKKEHLINTNARLDFLLNLIFQISKELNWELLAWAILINHYHIMIHTKEKENNIKNFIHRIHSKSAYQWNKEDNTKSRKVWFNYWESIITYEKSYYARLKYINDNPTLHNITDESLNYKWCSKRLYFENTPRSFYNTIDMFKVDQLFKNDIAINP